MSSPDQINPIKRTIPHDSRNTSNETNPTPKEDPVKTANFKRLMRQGGSQSRDKDEQEQAGISEGTNEAPSLFDLSKEKNNSKLGKKNLREDSSFSESTSPNESSGQLRNTRPFRQTNNNYPRSSPNEYVKSNNEDYSLPLAKENYSDLNNENYSNIDNKKSSNPSLVKDNYSNSDKNLTNTNDKNYTYPSDKDYNDSKKYVNTNDKSYTNSNVNERNSSNLTNKNYSSNESSINRSDVKTPYDASTNDELTMQEPSVPTEESITNLLEFITQNNLGTESDEFFSTIDQLLKDPTVIDQAKLQQTASLDQSKKPLVLDSITENITPTEGKKQDKVKSQAQANNNEFQEHIDLAAITPRIQSLDFSNQNASISQQVAVPRSTTLQEIAAQIISRIQVLRQEGQTDTTITLKNPPILEGSQLTITTNDHAQKEFNIKFSSLSPEAKLFLDRKLNEDSLVQTLERKGIIIHMLVTTTNTDTPVILAREQLFEREKQQQQREEKQEQELSEEEQS